jgi:succinylglutamate desuccinylase
LFINSEINYNLNEENNAFIDSQVSIFNIKQYDFLSKYKSYIDCSNLHKIDYYKIFNQIENHSADFKGTLEKDILKKIIVVADTCPLLPQVVKDIIKKNFTPLLV